MIFPDGKSYTDREVQAKNEVVDNISTNISYTDEEVPQERWSLRQASLQKA